MEKHATARYAHENEDFELRFVHKYYLPLALRPQISPADIEGIRRCFKDEKSDDWVRIPEEFCDCVITFKDIGMEKRIDAETARQVLVAYKAYDDEDRAELTPEEEQAAINLNSWLIDWEKRVLAECIQLNETIERRILSGDSWLTDYEIDVTVYFYTRADDPFSYDNMPDSWKDDVDSDSSLLCQLKLSHLKVTAEEVAKENYWNIGDSRDHNDFSCLYDEHERPERHCHTYHELYDHRHFPRKHMKRIGRVYTDIVVRCQNGTDIDLSGDRVVAVQHEPEVREDFVL